MVCAAISHLLALPFATVLRGGFHSLRLCVSPSIAINVTNRPTPFSNVFSSLQQPEAFGFQLVPVMRLVFCLTSAETKYKTILEYTLGLSREIRLDCAFVSVVGLEMQHSAAKSRWVVFLRATNIRAAMFVTWG